MRRERRDQIAALRMCLLVDETFKIKNRKSECDFLLSLSSVMLLSMKNIHDVTEDFLSLSSKGTKIEIRKRKVTRKSPVV